MKENEKNNFHSCKSQFFCIKVGFKGVKIIYACFRDVFCFRTVIRLFPLPSRMSPGADP